MKKRGKKGQSAAGGSSRRFQRRRTPSTPWANTWASTPCGDGVKKPGQSGQRADLRASDHVVSILAT